MQRPSSNSAPQGRRHISYVGEDIVLTARPTPGQVKGSKPQAWGGSTHASPVGPQTQPCNPGADTEFPTLGSASVTNPAPKGKKGKVNFISRQKAKAAARKEQLENAATIPFVDLDKACSFARADLEDLEGTSWQELCETMDKDLLATLSSDLSGLDPHYPSDFLFWLLALEEAVHGRAVVVHQEAKLRNIIFYRHKLEYTWASVGSRHPLLGKKPAQDSTGSFLTPPGAARVPACTYLSLDVLGYMIVFLGADVDLRNLRHSCRFFMRLSDCASFWRSRCRVRSSADILPDLVEFHTSTTAWFSGLPINRVDTPYPSVGSLLDTHYFLLRAEAFAPLLEVAQHFRAGSPDATAEQKRLSRFVFDSVKLVGMSCPPPADDGPRTGGGSLETYFTLEVDHAESPVVTGDKRFLPGNLICLSRDRYLLALLAHLHCTILDQTMHQLWIMDTLQACEVKSGGTHAHVFFRFERPSDVKSVLYTPSSTRRSWALIVSPLFYTAFKSVITRLQSMQDDEFPFAREFLSGTPDDHDRLTKNGKILQDKILGAIKAQATLDPTQGKAFKHAFKRRVAMIQGPPGTGKSYVGKQIARALL
eukprot:gene9209-235_t